MTANTARTTTASSDAVLTAASEPLIRAMIEHRADRHRPGVLGVRARLAWGGGASSFEAAGAYVRVVTCASSLAVRDALRGRHQPGWLVIVTDRPESDLGVGITAHFVGRRLITADAWQAVQAEFGAARVDHRLFGDDKELSRAIATGLLRATPVHGWTPAPAGVLTADHAFSAVARLVGLTGSGAAPAVPDRADVLAWSSRPTVAAEITQLRALAGDALTDATLTWCAERGGPVSGPWRALIAGRTPAELVPYGLVLTPVLASATGSAARTLLSRDVGVLPDDAALRSWATESEDLVRGLLAEDRVAEDHVAAGRLLRSADAVLDRLAAAELAATSAVLERSLRERTATLGRALRAATAGAPARAADHSPDAALVTAAELADIEQAWASCAEHVLVQPAAPRAGVRLVRWLAQPTASTGHVSEYRQIDAWIDRCVSDAWRGADDEQLAAGLGTVLAAVRLRRDAHDRAFAAALAHGGGWLAEPGVVPVERLLTEHVLKDGLRALVVVADGMSAANASEITADVTGHADGWIEHHVRGGPLSALAALPSITNVSRASLLCGEMTTGDQHREQRGFAALCAGREAGVLFHKAALERSQAGHVLAADVISAIDDPKVRVVACVLNTIDDALDRSDPGGTSWTAEAVKHLAPLLERARRAGRAVVLTSDHGNIVERREGHLIPGAAGTGERPNRWRPAGEPPPSDAEVLVRGERIHGGEAILAVDERVRYSTLKAGYHGGGAPAEVVIPVVFLAAGDPPAGWRPAPPPEPLWWERREVMSTPLPRVPSARDTPTLFDQQAPMEVLAPADLASQVVASPQYAGQGFQNQSVKADQLVALLRACLAAPGGSIDEAAAARALSVPLSRLAGAVSQAQRLLNIEQYPVLVRDAERRRVVLAEDLLRDQFRITG